MSRILKYRVYCNTDSKYEEWYLPSTSPTPTTCPVDTAHTIDTSKTTSTNTGSDDSRNSADGASVVKLDPGTSTTDPKLYPHQFIVPLLAGDSWFDLDCPVGSYLQYMVFQTKGAVFGDLLSIHFRLISDDTVVGNFGGVNPLMQKDNIGWSEPRREPVEIGTAKLIPAGVKVSLKYTASDALGRLILMDACVHEDP